MASKWEEQTYQTIALKRSRFFKPLAIILHKLGFTPNGLTYLGIVSMVLFVFVVGNHPVIAFWLLVAQLLFDQLDGAAARYLKTDSDRGKFIDVLADCTSFSLFIIGLIGAGYVTGMAGAVYIYFMSMVKLLMSIINNVDRKSNWLFYSGAGAYPSTLAYISYALFGLAVFTGFDHLQSSTVLFSILLIIKALSSFATIKSKPVKRI